jgi:hypothetical protein
MLRVHNECSSKHAPPLQIDTWLEALTPKPGDPKPISFRLVAPAQALPMRPLSSTDAEPTDKKLPDPMFASQKVSPSQIPDAALTGAASVSDPKGPGSVKSEAQPIPSPFDALKKAAEAYAQGKLQQAENPTSEAPKAPPVTVATNHFPAAPIPSSLGSVPGFTAPTDPSRPPGFFPPSPPPLGPPGFQAPPSNAPQSTVQRPPQQDRIQPGAAPPELIEEAFSDDEAVTPPSKLSSAAPGGVDLPPGFGFPKPEKPLTTLQTAPVPAPWDGESAQSLPGVAPALPRLQEMSTPYSTSGITPPLVPSEPSVRLTPFGDPDDLPEELLEPPGFVPPNLWKPEPNLEVTAAQKTGQQLANSQRPTSASSGGQGGAKETDQKPPGFGEAATGKQVQRSDVVRASHHDSTALGPDVGRNAEQGMRADLQEGVGRPGKRTWSESDGDKEAPRGAKRAALTGQAREERATQSGGAQVKNDGKSKDGEESSRGAIRGGVTGRDGDERQGPFGARDTKDGKLEGMERDSSRGEASARKTGVRQEQSGAQAKSDEKSKVTEGASRGKRQDGVNGRDKDGRKEQSGSRFEKLEDTAKGAKRDGAIGRKSGDRQGQCGGHVTKAKESEGAERASRVSTKGGVNGRKWEEREQQSGARDSKGKTLEGAEGASREAKQAGVDGRKSEERVQEFGGGPSNSTKSEVGEGASREVKRAGLNGRNPEEREQQAAKSEKSEEQRKLDAELLRRLEAVKERQSLEEEERRRPEGRESQGRDSGKGSQEKRERGSRQNEGAEKSDPGNATKERLSYESGRTRKAEYGKGDRREGANEVERLRAGERRGCESTDERRREERREGARAKDDFAPGKDLRRREEGRREVDGWGKEAERERSVAERLQPRDGRGRKDVRSSSDGRNQPGVGGRDPDEERRRENGGTKEQRQPLARLMKTQGVLEERRKLKQTEARPDPETSALKASGSGKSMEGQGGHSADEPIASSTTQLPNPSVLSGHQSRPAASGASNGSLENAAKQARHRLQNGAPSLEKALGRVESGGIARPPSPAGSRSSSPAPIRAASPALSDSRTVIPRKALPQGSRMELSNLGRPPRAPPTRESAQLCRENGLAGKVAKTGDSAQTSGESRNSALAASTADSVESQMLGVLLGGAESNGDKKSGALEKEGSGDLALGLTRPSVEVKARRNMESEMLGVLLNKDEKEEHQLSAASTRPSEMAPAGSSGDLRVEALLSGLDAKERGAIEVERARRLGEQDRMLEARKLCLVLDLDHTLLNSAKVGRMAKWKSRQSLVL